MKVLDAEFVQGYIRMANDGWEQGWHKRNGGNLIWAVMHCCQHLVVRDG